MTEPKTYAVTDETFGIAVREARERSRMTQAQLAEEMKYRGFDFHQQTVYRLESGKRKVTIGEALALAELVEVPVEVLAARNEDSIQRRVQALRFLAKQTVQYMEEVDSAAREALHKQQELKEAAIALDRITAGNEKADGDPGQSWAEHYRPIFQHPMSEQTIMLFVDLLDRVEYEWVDEEWKRGDISAEH